MKLVHLVANAPLYTNSFLVIGDKGHAVAIDPEAPAAKFEAALAENGASLTHILLTHGHFDHISSVEPLRESSGAKLWMSDADAAQFGLRPDGTYTDGGSIAVDDMVFTTILTPGHTPGSAVIRCGPWLFTGDTLFAGDVGRTDLAGGDDAAMRRSLQKLLAAVPDNPQVLPGHEEFSTMDEERAHNPYLRF